MNRKENISLLCGGMLLAAAVCLPSCSASTPGAMDYPVPTAQLTNVEGGDFESGLDGWTVEGGASVSLSQDGCVGSQALQLSGTASVSRQLTGLADGIYSLEFYAKNQGGQTACYVEAGGRRTSPMVSPTVWTKACVRGIEVKGGQCTVAIKSEGSEAVSKFDGLKLVKEEKPYTLIKGGDVSLLSYVEQNGGKYYEDGKADDCLAILKRGGINAVRLRLYNDPGYEGDSIASRLPKGIQDEADILRLAKRAKEAGMQIVLTFHYSDYWTNGESQHIPHAWRSLGYEELKTAVGDFTRSFLEKMKAQGTSPEYVAIGNETQAGLLYPLGACANDQQMCGLLNAGCQAVRTAVPDARIIIHLNGAADKAAYNWYLGLLRDWHVDYDIIGASYYPFWTGKDATSTCEWAEYVTDKFDKDLLYMETGYAWNATLPDGTSGQLSHNGPYEAMTKRGQKDFMLELTQQIKNVANQRVLGYLYWDPIYINVPGIGWELGAKNVVSNTTLFDFDGNALEVFDAIKNN